MSFYLYEEVNLFRAMHQTHHSAENFSLSTAFRQDFLLFDENYAGILIMWDRLFGTFAAERDDEEIAYGLVLSNRILHIS